MTFKKIAAAALLSACAISGYAADNVGTINAGQTATFTFSQLGTALDYDVLFMVGSSNSTIAGAGASGNTLVLTPLPAPQYFSFSMVSTPVTVAGSLYSGSGHSGSAIATDSNLSNGFNFGTLVANQQYTLHLTTAPMIGASSITGGGVIGVSAVPEPESYAMLLAGLGALGFMGRRRQPKQG